MDHFLYFLIVFLLEIGCYLDFIESRPLNSTLIAPSTATLNPKLEKKQDQELMSAQTFEIDGAKIKSASNEKDKKDLNYYITMTSPSTETVLEVMKNIQFDDTSDFNKAIDTLISSNNETLIGYNKGDESIEFIPSQGPGYLNSENLNNYVKVQKEGNEYKLEEENRNPDSSEDNHNLTTIESTKSEAQNDSHLHPDFKSCGKFPLDKDEYKILPDNTVIARNQTYNSSFYKFMGDSLLVCAPNSTGNMQLKITPKYPPVFVYISSAGISISILFLVLHLIVFCFEKTLRNLPGWNMASMVLATLFGHILFVLGQLKIIQGVPCVVIGVLTYYFFFVSFMWMNIMAFDVWRTLRMSTIKLQGPFLLMKWRRFIAYSMYSWGIPLLGVTASVIVDNILPGNSMYRPRFGEHVCWFGQRRPLFIFFAMPIVLIITVNIIFFIMCARILVITNASNTFENKTVVRKHYLIYVRLMIIMGLSWIFGIIAGSVSFQPIWYLSVLLNTLYGLFIFLAFTCNSKVKKEFRQKLVEYSRKLSTPQVTMSTNVNTQKEDTTTQ